MKKIKLPKDQANVIIPVGNRSVTLTNLKKAFWKKLGITKGDLIQYYIDVSSYLLISGSPMFQNASPHSAIYGNRC